MALQRGTDFCRAARLWDEGVYALLPPKGAQVPHWLAEGCPSGPHMASAAPTLTPQAEASCTRVCVCAAGWPGSEEAGAGPTQQPSCRQQASRWGWNSGLETGAESFINGTSDVNRRLFHPCCGMKRSQPGGSRRKPDMDQEGPCQSHGTLTPWGTGLGKVRGASFPQAWPQEAPSPGSCHCSTSWDMAPGDHDGDGASETIRGARHDGAHGQGWCL